MTAKISLRRILLLGVLVAVLGACATPPEDPEARAEFIATNDPWEPFNRSMFQFSRDMDVVLIRPIAEFYGAAVPRPVRTGVRNVIDNMRAPVYMINELLQGEFALANETFARFAVNSTFGIAGIFDVYGGEQNEEDFGQTLAVWGVGPGPYLWIPVFGPRPPRDALGFAVDGFVFDPFNWWARLSGNGYASILRFAVDSIDLRERNIETLDEIERTAIDYYATIRSLYRQRRESEIRQGAPPPATQEDLFFDLEEDDSIENEPSS